MASKHGNQTSEISQNHMSRLTGQLHHLRVTHGPVELESGGKLVKLN
jgi:hypothetical protein